MDLTNDIITLACRANVKITCAESCTGGLVCAALTETPGSSKIFDRGFVVYSNLAKIQTLEVSKKSIQAYGAVSEQVAIEMAIGAKKIAKADIALAISGIAGPGGSEFKPEGQVAFGFCWNNESKSETIEFGPIGRKNVRSAATEHALKTLLKHLKTAY